MSVAKRLRNRAVFRRGSLSCSCAARSAACVLRASADGAPARSLSRLTSYHGDVSLPTIVYWFLLTTSVLTASHRHCVHNAEERRRTQCFGM